jgi:hypothetical protein
MGLFRPAAGINNFYDWKGVCGGIYILFEPSELDAFEWLDSHPDRFDKGGRPSFHWSQTSLFDGCN